jgi:hypothetical protein
VPRQKKKAKREDKGQQRISHSFNNKLLIASLLAMLVIGSTYYVLDARPEVFQTGWLVLSGLWYFFIAFSLFFVYNGARLGAITSGIIGWITLTLWLVDNIYTISGNSLIATSPDLTMTIRNFIGAVVASLVVATSHEIYHKIRLYGT